MQTAKKPWKTWHKVVLGVIAFIFIFIFLVTKNAKPAQADTASDKAAQDQRLVDEKVRDAIYQEKKVKEVLLTDANVIYVSVLDDGTNRDGFAEYICQVAKEAGSQSNEVKVVKFGSTNSPQRDNAYGVLLGKARCK